MIDIWVLKPVVAPQALTNTTALRCPEGEVTEDNVWFSQPPLQPPNKNAIVIPAGIALLVFMICWLKV
jgi:hypothetical protein